MSRQNPPSQDQLVKQSVMGAQSLLLLSEVPATADPALLNTPLAGKTLTVTGLYRCLVPLAGLVSNLQLYLNATWSGGTVSSEFDTLHLITAWPTIPAKKGASVTGDGSMTTATLQTITTEALNGEQYAVLEITLTGTTSVAFTMAEFNGK